MKSLLLFVIAVSLPASGADPAAPAAGSPPPVAPAAAPVVAPPAPSVASYPVDPPLAFNRAPQVRLDVLMLAVSEDKILPLLPQLRDPAKAAVAEAALLELVAKKQARLLDWPALTLHSGERSVSESILEYAFPIDYEQPSASVCGLSAPGNDKKAEPSPAEKALAMLRSTGLAIPTSFETRNSGATLEATAAVAPDAQAVTVQMAPQFVSFEGDREFPAGRTEKGEPITIKYPQFRVSKVVTTITLRDGERELIYFGKAAQLSGEVTVFIAGVRLQPPAK